MANLDFIKKIIKSEITSIEPLLGGMMNESKLVTTSKGRFVLYLPTTQANEMVDRKLEKSDQLIAYSLGVTSKNIYFDTTTGIKVNEFIEGHSLDKVNEFDYSKIATLLHKLHSSKELSVANYNPFTRFVNYENEAKQYLDINTSDYLEVRNFLFKHKDFLESQPLVFSHNDFQRSNVIKANDSEYKMIDFEFTGNNDEIYDIACFGNGEVKEGFNLLNSYFDNPNEEQTLRFYLWRILISLQWRNVALIKHFRGEGKTHGFDFTSVAKHFMDNAKEAYSSIASE